VMNWGKLFHVRGPAATSDERCVAGTTRADDDMQRYFSNRLNDIL